MGVRSFLLVFADARQACKRSGGQQECTCASFAGKPEPADRETHPEKPYTAPPLFFLSTLYSTPLLLLTLEAMGASEDTAGEVEPADTDPAIPPPSSTLSPAAAAAADMPTSQKSTPTPDPAASQNRGRSSSSSSKPRMLSQVGGQRSTNFIHRMFHPKDSGTPSLSGSDKATPTTGGSGSRERGLKLELPTPNGLFGGGPASSPPITPGSANGHHSPSGPPSIATSRSPSRTTSFRRRGSSSATTADPNAVHPSHLADKLNQVNLKSNGGAGRPGLSAQHDSSNPISPPLEAVIPPTPGTEKGRFNLKDLISSGPKLSRKASASSAASKSEKGGKSAAGSEKGGYDGVSTVSLLTKYGVCEKNAIGKGATAVVRLAHKWDRREEKLYAVKVSHPAHLPLSLLTTSGLT